MSACRFRFELGRPAETLVAEIQSHIERAGGRFEQGAFSLPTPVGEFRGDYRLAGTAIEIVVTEKPFFVPCSTIEARLAQYVRKAP